MDFRITLGATVFALAGLVAPSPASAQDWRSQDFRNQEAAYELYVDQRGRRFLVDPWTGEVVRQIRGKRRFLRNQRLSRNRDERRDQLQRELNKLFGLHENSRPRRRDRADRSVEDEVTGTVNRGKKRWSDKKRNKPKLKKRKKPQPHHAKRSDEEVLIARLEETQPVIPNVEAVIQTARPRFNRTEMAQLQVVLDRAGFSPGVIDGKWGKNVAKAVEAWKEAGAANVDHTSRKTLKKLIRQSGGATFSTYMIKQEDVSGPFIARVPIDYARKAQLEAMSYTSVREKLAEKFHMSEAYLKLLNPGKDFRKAGTVIKVVKPGKEVKRRVHYIVADKGKKQLRAFDRNGKLVAAYPATIGSASNPSPSGSHTVSRVAFDPEYTYNPKKNFQQGDNDKILRIPPGPNGPVGSVWIALSKPSYGIHGTPNPDAIGKTRSHGCIRLTNWDAQELAKLVRKGVTVEFVQ